VAAFGGTRFSLNATGSLCSTRAFLGVVASGELERVVLVQALGLADRPQDRLHGERAVGAITSAISSAFGQRLAVGHDVTDQPISLASAAVMCRPVSSRSRPPCTGSGAPAAPRSRPSGTGSTCASETPNLALSPATRMSVPCRISVPPAIAGPSTAAISGLVSRALEQRVDA
jgi:hypothetical protein